MRSERGVGSGGEDGRRTPLAVAIALCAGALVLCLPTLRKLFDTWATHQYYSQVAVMAGLATWLVHSNRERLAHALRQARPPAFGFVLVLGAAAFQVLMYLGDLNWPAGFGISLLLAATAYAVGGLLLLRPLAAPLACLALMVPPGFLLNPVCGYAVRPLVGHLAQTWLQLSGAAVLVQGHHLQLPGGRLVLVPSCCGLVPMLSLVVLASLVAVWRIRGAFRRVVLVASVVPLVVGVNAIRVVVAARRFDVIGQREAQSLLASDFSVPTLAAGILVIAGLARVLQPRADAHASPRRPRDRTSS
jgi:exosortase